MALGVSVWLVLWIVVGLFALTVILLTFRYIPNDRVGIVEKLWSPSGSVTHGIIALNGEAGFQPALLRGGWHVMMPFQYRLHQMPLVTIPQGKIGYVFARDGQPLPPTQTLASNVSANDFQDVSAFMGVGGQRGPQRKILREGTYALNTAQFVVIGTPTAGVPGSQIETILTQLRSRQIAEEQVETYTRQEKAAMKEMELREAEARAKQQTFITESELSISIQSNEGKAEYERSRQEAARIQTLASAEAEKIRILGEGEAKRIQAIAGADAERTARVGIAQAMAIEEQVRAYGGPRLQLTQQVLNRFAEAIQASKVDVVPKILIAGSNGKQGGSPMTGNVMEALLTLMLSERLGGDIAASPAPRNASADAIRKRIEDDMKR